MSADYEEVRAVLAALFPKLTECTDIFSERDLGYCLAGLSNMQQYLYSEVDQIVEDLQLKVAQSGLGGLQSVTFLKFGRGIRVKTN